MSKVLSFAVSFVLLLCLSGCQSGEYPRETDMEYMVSSIGFDKNAKTVSISAEIIVVNSSDSEKGAQPQIFTAEGETASSALYNLHASLSKPLMLKHCGLLVLGDGVDSKTINEIFKICLENKNITQAIQAVAAPNALELISVKPISNIAVGYEISEALKQNSEYTGIKYENRFYEIEAKREGKAKSYAIPYFSVEQEKYKIDGLKVYANDSAVVSFDNESAVFYSIMSNSYKKGEIMVDKQSFKAELKSVKYDFSYQQDRLLINVSIVLKASDENLQKLKSIINGIAPPKTDIYGIADQIYRKEPEIWEDIKDNYGEIFKNSEISFEVEDWANA